MLTDAGATIAIVGHSERREAQHESDEQVRAKAEAALAAGLDVILCVGESSEVRDSGAALDVVDVQLRGSLPADIGGSAALAVAYEPIWAIGTGKVASPEQAQEAIAFVRALVNGRSPEAATRLRVLYGGSVKPDNAAEILAQPDVDGALVGGASLDPDGFARIVAAAA
jgi:triosephosphate isomerase